jgi:MFS family permease
MSTTLDRNLLISLSSTTGIQALVTMISLTVSVMAPTLARELELDVTTIGIYASISYIGAMIGSLLSGGFVRRYGPIRISQIIMCVCALGLLICLGNHWIWFLLSAFICGLGYGPATPASSQLLARHVPSQYLSLGFSIKQTGVPLGGILAGLLVPWLLVQFNWQTSMIVLALFVMALGAGLQKWRHEFDTNLEPTANLFKGNFLSSLKLVITHPKLKLIAIATFFFSATQQCYIYFLVTFLETDLGWVTQQAGMALAIVGVSAVIGRILWGIAADATGRSNALIILLAFAMAGITILTGFVDSDWPTYGIFGLCACFGATGAAWNGIYLAEITRKVDDKDVSRATGGGLFITFFGVVIGPPAFGLVATTTDSFQTAYLFLGSATFFIGAILLLSLTVSKEKS